MANAELPADVSGSPIRPGMSRRAITVALQVGEDVPRVALKISPYSKAQNGFGVTVPIRPAPPSEIAVVDVRKALRIEPPGARVRSGLVGPEAFRRSMVVNSEIKLSFHPSGFVQFSPAGKDSFLSGMHRSPVKAAKGFGMFWSPPEWIDQPGPTFGAAIYRLADHDPLIDDGKRPIEIFRSRPTDAVITRRMLAGRHTDWILETDAEDRGGESFVIEGYVLPRSMLTETEFDEGRLYLHLHPSHWDVARHVRLLDWGDANWILGLAANRRSIGSDYYLYSIHGPHDRTRSLHLGAFAPPMKRRTEADGS